MTEEIKIEDLSAADLKRLLDGKRRHKYGAKKNEVDGFVFASKREAAYYSELKIRERVGEIIKLELQPRFECIVNGKKICTYIADFRYLEVPIAKWEPNPPPSVELKSVVVDVKGFKTPEYRLKKKLVEALFHIQITEV